MFRTVDPVASTTLQSYEHRQLLDRARRYIYIKGAVNAVIALLFLLTLPPGLMPRMVAIVLADALLLAPYWFLVQRYPTLATCLSLCMTALAISAEDWVGGYQTGASGILYALLILGGHLVLIKPLSTYLVAGLITTIYVGTIVLEVKGVIPIHFPFTLSNLQRVVSLNAISMFGMTILIGVVTRLYRELLQRNRELLTLNAVSAAASQSLNLDEVLQLALDRVLEVMELEGGGLYLLEASTGEMVLKVHRNLPGEFLRRVSRMEVGIEGFTDSPLRTGQVLVLDDFSQHPVVSKIVGNGNGHRLLAIVPLKVEDRVLGMMNLLGRTGYFFTSQDVELLNTIGTQISMTIENAHLYEELKHQHERLQQTQEQMLAVERWAVLGKAAANLAHRINNTAGLIPVITQDLKELLTDVSLEEERRQEIDADLQRVERNTRFTLQMADALFKPFESLPTEECDVNILLEESTSFANVPEDVALTTKYADGLSKVFASRLLADVFVELITNAVKAMPDGGELEIGSRLGEEGWVEVWFSDRGHGIPPESRDKIFDLFFTTSEDSLGFGLWWVKTFLLQQGATIDLESEIGKGTTFTVRLPVKGPQAAIG